MNTINEHNHSSVVPYENIIMPNFELPINFIEHNYSSTGPFCILHWHNEIEMVYVKEGTISVTYGSRTNKVQSGSLVFVNCNEPHGYSVEEAPIVLYCCTFAPTLLQGRYATSYDSKFIEPNKSVTVFNNLITDDSNLTDLFLSMWDEGYECTQGYEYAIKSNLFAIMALMVRHHVHHTIDNRKQYKINRNLRNINKVIQYIEKNYKKDISLDELADFSSFNRYYFCRLFKDVTGITPIKYLNDYRIHQAIALMQQQPSMQVTEIATTVGFNDPNYFARVFKDLTNETPTMYRDKFNLPK